MYLNVFIVYLWCIWMYLNVFECIYIYIYGVFECIYNILMVYFNLFIIYLNAFIVCFNVFHCISMCLNVFIYIIIGILSSHSHCNVFTMHTHLHIFFSLYTMTPFRTCFTTALFFFHSHWSVPTFIQFMKKLHINSYFMSIHHPTFHVLHSTFHILRSTFHVVSGCAKHSGAQVCIFMKAMDKFIQLNTYFFIYILLCPSTIYYFWKINK
jgi:hypothetical protein